MYVKDDTAVIAHPKTGSMSLCDVLTNQMGYKVVGKHHSVEDTSQYERVVSVIREPFDWYTSWYFHYKKRDKADEPFDDWLVKFCTGENRWHRKGFYGLPLTTHVVFYEDLQQGLTDLLDAPTLPRRNAGPREPVETKKFFDSSKYDALKEQREGSYLEVKIRHRPLLGYNPFFCIKDINGQIPQRTGQDRQSESLHQERS